jgi:hypothetical protein
METSSSQHWPLIPPFPPPFPQLDGQERGAALYRPTGEEGSGRRRELSRALEIARRQSLSGERRTRTACTRAGGACPTADLNMLHRLARAMPVQGDVNNTDPGLGLMSTADFARAFFGFANACRSQVVYAPLFAMYGSGSLALAVGLRRGMRPRLSAGCRLI